MIVVFMSVSVSLASTGSVRMVGLLPLMQNLAHTRLKALHIYTLA